MSEPPPYPPIEPTTYDLIVVGTGLPESIIAAAASAAGKSVLHLDPNPFYGSHFSSLSISELVSFLQCQSATSTSTPPSAQDNTTTSFDCISISLTTCPLYSDVEVSPIPPDLEHLSRKFSLDVSGPRVLFCAGSTIDLLMKSGVSPYLEFKSIDGSFIYDGNGNLLSVPDSRAAIFKDRSLELTEKNKLMRFFKDVQAHLEAVAGGEGGGGAGRVIAEEDLESPFVEFLDKKQLPLKIKSIILYAIAMTNYDQQDMDASKNLLKTSDGINRLALYHSSLGRFSNASGALLYPMYGQGELPQAFCRRAAVKGCLYVLRMPAFAVLVDRGNAGYKGITLASGQDIFSHQLVLDPNYVVSQASASLPDLPVDRTAIDFKGKIARGICITRQPLNSDASNLLVVYPPRSLYSEQATSIRVLQVGSNLAVCPQDMYVLYLSACCGDAYEGKKLLNAVIDVLFTSGSTEDNFSGDPEDSSSAQTKDMEVGKPTLLWSVLYIQEVTEGSCETISSAFSPDGDLSYDNLIDATQKMFRKLFPNEEFFPNVPSSGDCNDSDWADPEL
ncbi:hypothetical protein Dimus_017035 [Dionaea muscipula]